MLERVNAALFKAPRGARIQIVAENNNGVNDGRFEPTSARIQLRVGASLVKQQ